MNPLLNTDFYKVHHGDMYPEGTVTVYSNLTPRGSKIKGIDKVVFFGLQYFIQKYLVKKMQEDFFNKSEHEIELEYIKYVPANLERILALHRLGYLPIRIKALPEGSLVNMGIPVLTITNTLPEFYWLPNYLETIISTMLWQPCTSATIAFEYKKLLTEWAVKTTGSSEFVQWQGHDFSMRGMPGVGAAVLSGMGHLLSFTGTDTIPAIYALDEHYMGYDDDVIGASVPATEHSIMCMGTEQGEFQTYSNLLDLYPEGILSIVSDTWDFWAVCTDIIPALKDKIMARNGKVVIRPDSGDPVDIICGTFQTHHADYNNRTLPEEKGAIELLWDTFGGTVNELGYKELDSHIGLIYGDSITPTRAKQICERLAEKGFASTNVVLGIGSMTYTGGDTNFNNLYWITRDTFGYVASPLS